MKLQIEKEVLAISLEGQLTATNAADIEKEIQENLTSNINKVIIDAKNLEYISSAGLRVLLGITKKVKDTSVINVSRDVYDIFEMTGFSTFLKIEKKLREISIEGCPIIGEGATAKVYRLNQDTIVKVFTIDRTVERIQEEIGLAKKAFICGVPTAISFDIVQVGDKLGVVFEMLDAYSVCELIKQNPENIDSYIDMLVDLLKKLRDTDASNSGLRNAKEYYLEQLEVIKAVIDEEHYNKTKKLLNEMPDSKNLVHGDFHIKNIMVQNGEPLLIDMDTVSVGNQVFEFGSFYIGYLAYPETEPENPMRFFGISNEMCQKIYYDSIKKSFPNANEQELKDIQMKIQAVGSIRMVFFCLEFNEPELRKTTAIKRFYEALDAVDSFAINY